MFTTNAVHLSRIIGENTRRPLKNSRFFEMDDSQVKEEQHV
ncbi:hypothetical protein I656_02388 [Geobacillus sp. WSUCF1]|nr:hypothetical protein I656_02388 [Geobacillus sp. WSUCF1]